MGKELKDDINKEIVTMGHIHVYSDGVKVVHDYKRYMRFHQHEYLRRRCHNRDVVLHVQLCSEFSGQRTVVHVKSQLRPG